MYQAVMENKNSRLATAKTPLFPKLLGAAAGIFGGLILMLTGMILSVVSYFNRLSFSRFGSDYHSGIICIFSRRFAFFRFDGRGKKGTEN